MVLEGLYCSFGGIDAVFIGWHELPFHVVVAEKIAFAFKICENIVECSHDCGCFTVGDCSYDNGIGCVVVCNKNILLVLEGHHWESTGQIVFGWNQLDLRIGWDIKAGRDGNSDGWWTWACRANAGRGFLHMAFSSGGGL
eukprot:scaffold130666_cov22-Cyclotella_meneghiniana.AAC.1